MQSCRNRLNNLQKESGGQKVSNPALMRKGTNKEGQRCHAGRRAAMPLKTGSNAIRDEQKVCIYVRMVGQAPGRESSELTEPESRPPRGNPKLEEQSVGGSVALSPGIPDAQQIRFPGESTKPPVVKGAGLVDGAMSPEKPVARKPDQRKVSIKVSRGIKDKRAVKATGDDPHGLPRHGPIWTDRPNDPHGLLVNRPNMAHKQGMPPGTLTTKGTQPTQVHDGNPNRATPSKPGARAGRHARALSTDRGGPPQGHNRNQPRTIGIVVVALLGILILISMINQGSKTIWRDTIPNTGRTYRNKLLPGIIPHGEHGRECYTYTWRKWTMEAAPSEEIRTRGAVAYDMATATLNNTNKESATTTQIANGGLAKSAGHDSHTQDTCHCQKGKIR